MYSCASAGLQSHVSRVSSSVLYDFKSSTASLNTCRVDAVEIVAVVGTGRASRRELQIGSTLATVDSGASYASLERLGIDAVQEM